MKELSEVTIHPLVSNTVKNQLARAFCYLILQSKAVGTTLFDIVLSHEGKLQIIVNAKGSDFLNVLKDDEARTKIAQFFGKDFKIDEKGIIKKEFENCDHLNEFLTQFNISKQIDVETLYQELQQESDELYQELRKAFEAFHLDDAAFNDDQGDGVLKQNFQTEFLKINKDLVENVKNAIFAFIANPQNQACIIRLERLLIQMSVKIHSDLDGEKSFTAGDFVPIANAILEIMSDATQGFEIRHAEFIELLLNNWGEDRITFWFPMSVMNILLGQIYGRLPSLTEEQTKAYKELEVSLLKIEEQRKRFDLYQEVKSYFDNRLFSDLEKTQKLIVLLNQANIQVPQYLSFPLSREQEIAYQKLDKEIKKLFEETSEINSKEELNLLMNELTDYFDFRLFYNKEKTQSLIANLKKANFSVPKCFYVNRYVLTPSKLENSSNQAIINLKNKNWIFEASNSVEAQVSLDTNRDKAAYMLHEAISFNFMPGYMLMLGQASPQVNVEVMNTSTFSVITYNLLIVVKLDMAIPGKWIFSIPGQIEAIFEETKPGFQFKAIETSNQVLLKLMTEKLTACSETILDNMVAQAKQEESYDSLNEWYRAQSKIFLSPEFSQKYKYAFDCEGFKKKFEEEASEFLGISKKTETAWSMLGQVVGKVKLDVGKLFREDEENTEIIYSENHAEEYTEEYKFIRDFYSVIKGNKYNISFKNIKIPQPFPKFNLDYNDDSLCITIPHEAKEFIAVFKKHNAKLNVADKAGNIHAVFKSPGELKEFLIACKVPDLNVDKMAQNLYEALHKEKYKYFLTLDELEKSSNAEIVLLKNLDWMYASINRNGGIFSQDINRDTRVNGRELNPSKNSELISEKINAHAKKLPSIKQYQFVHLQLPSYLTRSIVTTNVSMGGFIVLETYNLSNVELTQNSAFLILNNGSFTISYSSYKKLDDLNKLLFFVPGHVQAVFEMVGEYRLQIISSKESIPEDKYIEENSGCLYLYCDQETLTYAVYDPKTYEVKRMVVGDNELSKDNSLRIREILQKPADSLDFETMEQIAVLLPFLKLVAAARYPILGLKLKTFKVSNSALRDLVTGNFEHCDENMLAEMVRRAKQEEPKESLYEWYKVQAKKFHEKGFPESYARVEFEKEVKQFLDINYKNPADKFEQFLNEVGESLNQEEYILDELSPQNMLSSSVKRPLPQIPQKIEIVEKNETEIDFVSSKSNSNTESDATRINIVRANQANQIFGCSLDSKDSNTYPDPKSDQDKDDQCRIS